MPRWIMLASIDGDDGERFLVQARFALADPAGTTR